MQRRGGLPGRSQVKANLLNEFEAAAGGPEDCRVIRFGSLEAPGGEVAGRFLFESNKKSQKFRCFIMIKVPRNYL